MKSDVGRQITQFIMRGSSFVLIFHFIINDTTYGIFK